MKKILYKIIFPFVNEKYNLENKWWHRLTKVIFTIIMILSLLILINNFNLIEKTENLFSYNNVSNIQTLRPVQQQAPITQKKPGFSVIPQASADNGNNTNIIQTFLDDSKTKPELSKKRNAVIQMLKNQEDDSFIQDTIVNKMGYKGITQQPTQQPQQTGFLNISLNIIYVLLSLYFINLILQIIYYQIILYIIYGKK